MKQNHYRSNIYPQLVEKRMHHLFCVTIVTLIITIPTALLIHNYFYPTQGMKKREISTIAERVHQEFDINHHVKDAYDPKKFNIY